MKNQISVLMASAALTLCAISVLTGNEAAGSKPEAGVSAKEALKLLKEGNKRFASNKPEHPHQTIERRAELSKAQHPFAVVLACADSRTAPEDF